MPHVASSVSIVDFEQVNAGLEVVGRNISIFLPNFLTKSFHFSSVDKGTVMKEIHNLKPRKTTQDTDIPIKSYSRV